MTPERFYIKTHKVNGKNVIDIELSISETCINEQPEEGFVTRAEALEYKRKLIKAGTLLTLRKDLRKRRPTGNDRQKRKL